MLVVLKVSICQKILQGDINELYLYFGNCRVETVQQFGQKREYRDKNYVIFQRKFVYSL